MVLDLRIIANIMFWGVCSLVLLMSGLLLGLGIHLSSERLSWQTIMPSFVGTGGVIAACIFAMYSAQDFLLLGSLLFTGLLVFGFVAYAVIFWLNYIIYLLYLLKSKQKPACGSDLN